MKIIRRKNKQKLDSTYCDNIFQLDKNDMFTVFGKEIATQMLLSKIPKFNQIKAMQKRSE